MLQVLFNRYGTGSQSIAKFMAEQTDSNGAASVAFEVATDSQPWFRGELEYLAQQELVCCADDILTRRTLIKMQGRSSAEATKAIEEIVGGQ